MVYVFYGRRWRENEAGWFSVCGEFDIPHIKYSCVKNGIGNHLSIDFENALPLFAVTDKHLFFLVWKI